MTEQDLLTRDELDEIEAELEERPRARGPLPTIRRLPPTIGMRTSGLYEWSVRPPQIPQPIPQPIPHPVAPPGPGVQGDGEETVEEIALVPLMPFLREELRLDIDGRYPLMVASGTMFRYLTTRVHWIASLRRVSPSTLVGSIWYKDGDVASLPQTEVRIVVARSFFANQRRATATFSGGGAANRTVVYAFRSYYFRPCEFEYDVVQGQTQVTSFDTSTHPNRPATLPAATLTIEGVYRQAGFNVTTSPGGGTIPITPAGSNAQWSDSEMNDAMMVYWLHFANRPQWAAWTLFAGLHEMGVNLGGIMFDSFGPNHRQGTAIFLESFINTPPAGDPNAAAAVQRIKFWTAVHELGHTFNLAHSWDKSAGTPWIPLANDPEARSFMNYPYGVQGGSTAFFSNFEYRFSDQELLFMRHAPERFVEQGAADWFDHHGFQQALRSPEPALQLTLRVNRERPDFEYLEPPVLELKLENVSGELQVVDANVLRTLDDMTVVLKKGGGAARIFRPFARYCYRGERKVLQPGESLYESLFAAVGLDGWSLDEPGRYLVQVALHGPQEDIVSNPLELRILPPRSYDEERIAQDFFVEDVGRTLAFDGSRLLTSAIDTLHEVADRFSDRAVSLHARIALGLADAKEYKVLQVDPDTGEKSITTEAPDNEGAMRNLSEVLLDKTDEAAETLGHIDTKDYADAFTRWLEDAGRLSHAAQVQGALQATLERRNVAPRVLAEVQGRREQILSESGAKASERTPSVRSSNSRSRRAGAHR